MPFRLTLMQFTEETKPPQHHTVAETQRLEKVVGHRQQFVRFTSHLAWTTRRSL